MLEPYIVGSLVGVIIYLAGICGYVVADGSWRGELIKRGLAQYNPKTGAWEWIKKEDEK